MSVAASKSLPSGSGVAASKSLPSGSRSAAVKAARKSPLPQKRDRELERCVVEWIQDVTGERQGSMSTIEWLRDGRILCRLVNKIKPGAIRVNKMLSPAAKLENIRTFLKWAQMLGVAELSLFQPLDLYDARDMGAVISCIHTFAKAIEMSAPEYQGPRINTPTDSVIRGCFCLPSWLVNIFGPRAVSYPNLSSLKTSSVPEGWFTDYYHDNFRSVDAVAMRNIHDKFRRSTPKKCAVGWFATYYQDNFRSVDVVAMRDIHDKFRRSTPKKCAVGWFATYYRDSFRSVDVTAMRNIHDKFGSSTPKLCAIVLSNTKMACDNLLRLEHGMINDVSTDGGSVTEGALDTPRSSVSAWSSILGDESVPFGSVDRRFLPSMGCFSGPVGAYGGIQLIKREGISVQTQDAEVEELASNPKGTCFLPSMGSYHGPVGAHGGLIKTRDTKVTISEAKVVEPASTPRSTCFLPSMGSYHGPVGAHGGLMKTRDVMETTIEAKVEKPASTPRGTCFLPSMGSYHGPVGAHGGLIKARDVIETTIEAKVEKSASTPMGTCFLPSMGSYHGPVGAHGGLIKARDIVVQTDTAKVEELAILPVETRFLPSMGCFHGPVGAYGGIQLM